MLVNQRIPTVSGLATAPSSYGVLIPVSGTGRSQSPLLSRTFCWLLLMWAARPALPGPLETPPDPPAHTAELPTADAGQPLSLD